MSKTETHIGKFKIICSNDEDTKKYIKENLSEWWNIIEYKDGSWDINETHGFYEKYWKKNIPFDYDVIQVNDKHWLIKYEKHKEFDESEPIEEISLNSDGTYDFLTQFYNGGTCLSEMVGYMIEKIMNTI